MQLTLKTGATRAVHAFIFDSDGTLVDSEVPGMDVLYAEAKALGVHLTREQAHRQFRGVRMADCIAWVATQLGKDPESFADDFARRVRAAQALHFEKSLDVIPGAFDLLDKLTVPFCVATNGPREKVELTLGLTGLRHYFGNHLFSAYEIGSYKPEPGLFLHAARAMGIAPQYCCVVEDSLPGIQAALAADMQAVTLLPAAELPAHFATRVICINDLHELAAMLTTNETNAPYGAVQTGTDRKRKKVTTARIAEMRTTGEKIAMLTAYDATFAAVADAAGVDCILVGDSLGMVCQGGTTTVGVSLEDMCYHTHCVSQGITRSQGSALVIADLPFGSYQQSREQAIGSAVQLMQAGAQMIKLEGGGWAAETAAFLVERGIPVCGHLGLTPQTVSSLGGYRVQGRQTDAAEQMRRDAAALDAAGASMLVLEMIPAQLANRITNEMRSCATIGIGAGSGTAGQVLVMHDMLGLNLGHMAKFVRDFMRDAPSIEAAFAAYVKAVKDGSFPNDGQHAW